MRRNETMRRVICLLLIVAMTCTGVPVTAFGETVQGTDNQENLAAAVLEEEENMPVVSEEETSPTPKVEENKDVVETTPEVTETPEVSETPDVNEAPTTNTIKTGWVTNADGTWSYYDAVGVQVKGWLKLGGIWYFLKLDTGIMAASETVDVSGAKYRFASSGAMLAGNGWKIDQNIWYYVTSSGALRTGWLWYSGKWFYMDPETGAMCTSQWVDDDRYYVNAEGHMATGWVIEESTGNWYYLKSNGLAASGWLKYKNQWYYLKDNGLMVCGNWVKSGNIWYFMNDSGVMATGWVLNGGTWYYLNSDGTMKTGWLKLGKTWYYLNSSGAMATGWSKINNVWYYMHNSGVMATGWVYVGKAWYFLRAGGDMATGWLMNNGNWFYLKPDGAMVIGWVDGYYMNEWGAMVTNQLVLKGDKYYYVGSSGKIGGTGWKLLDGKWYYLDDNSMCITGWKKVGSTWYYMDPATTAMVTGFLQIGSAKYYFKSSGAMATGWEKVSGTWYYFNGSGAMQTGWQDINGQRYYLGTDGKMQVGWQKIDSLWYYFYSNGYMARSTMIGIYYVDANGVWKETASGKTDPGTLLFKDVAAGGKTIKNLLQNAMKAVANTLYIWGGGWDSEIGGDARRIGTNPQWKAFYDTFAGNYDYDDYRYSYKNGLDCSGYIGWAIYNTINTKSNQNSVTVQSTTVASYLVNTKGWGESSMLENPTVLRAGDICSMSGHVFMVVGACSDGSIVILHSSPQAGVQLSGSVVPSTGSQDSKAYALAKKYNEKYFPNWAYSTRCVGKSYFTSITRCRWKVNGSGILTDPDNYLNKTADQILANLFGE